MNYRTHLRRPEIDFEEAAGQLETALANAPNPPTQSDPAHKAPVNEVKLACAAGMLICLDRAHRLAYILGEVLEVPGEDAAAILEISPAGFRKRLSRAREQMEAFLRSPSAACLIEMRIGYTSMSNASVPPRRCTGACQNTRPRTTSLPRFARHSRASICHDIAKDVTAERT